MPAVRSVLVVGAGLAGTATAVLLARAGVSVDVVEASPEVGARGSGITLQGNALRVLRELGVWERVAEQNWPYDSLQLRAPDADGTVIATIQDARTGGPDLPATVGADRRRLATTLLDRAGEVGAKVRLGTSATGLEQDADGVDVTFSDDSRRRYDLVVGADGVRSWTRGALGIDLQTRPTGMGIWRVFATRPDSIRQTDLFYGGHCYIAGYSPTGPDSIYAYLVEDAQDRSALTPEEQLAVVRQLASAYHGPWDEVRERLVDPSQVNYTWFETHVLDRPWNRGRVVLIGDAAHACPPTLAQGGAQALEDAAVLTELLLRADAVDDALWDELMDRRHARAERVVTASLQLGQWLLDHDPAADVPGLMHTIAELVSLPA